MLFRLKGPLYFDNEEMLNYLKSRYIHPPSKEPYNLMKNNNSYESTMLQSSMVDIRDVIEKLYSHKQHGFFIEAGALDGQFMSNSLWLELSLNWTGLLIEPDPYNYDQLSKKNRKSWTSNSCLSLTNYAEQIFLKSLKPKTNDKYEWLFRSNNHNDKFIGTKYFEESSISKIYPVQCFPMASYIKSINITDIDVLFLDIQGGEDKIIYNFPWNTVNLTTVVVEHYFDEKRTFDKNLVHFMMKKGFILLAITGEPDYIFTKKDNPELKTFQYQPLQDRIENLSILKNNKTYLAKEFSYLEELKVIPVTYKTVIYE